VVNKKYEQLNDCIDQYLNSFEIVKINDGTSITLELKKDDLIEICSLLKNTDALNFSMLIDVCGVDYLHYGVGDWETTKATASGYSRAVQQNTIIPDPDEEYQEKRFAVIYHLLSIDKNWRIRLKTFTGSENPPIVQSVTGIWNSADWFEREAFDLFGILFENHTDLRRILTDYGFVGHPLRKDFPMIGEVEMRYDEELGRVVYEPVSIEPNISVPRVIRK